MMLRLVHHTNWFEIDKAGLARLIERGEGRRAALVRAFHELIANSFDAGARCVTCTLIHHGKGAEIVVIDDSPEGFRDLAHAYTLFAPSSRLTDATKRGRFNLGEKTVLALCTEATIRTTAGSVLFSRHAGRRTEARRRTNGSEFRGFVLCRPFDVAAVEREVQRVLPPQGVTVTVNGVHLVHREPAGNFVTALPTEVADDMGRLRRTERQARVLLHAPLTDETPALYEMGIPVVELDAGDPWHIDVLQKVPLSMERDNVTPAYLRRLRVAVANCARAKLTSESAVQPWAQDALKDSGIEPETVERLLTLQYGEKRVAFDPSDREANKVAASEGFTVIPPRAFSKEAWANVRRAGAAKPAGQVTPSHATVELRLEGSDSTVPTEKWTPGMEIVVGYASVVAVALLGRIVSVRIISDVSLGAAAFYGPKVGLTLNLGRLGHDWFDAFYERREGAFVEVTRLLLHELAHEKVSDHLSSDYHEEVARLGAVLTEWALKHKEMMYPARR